MTHEAESEAARAPRTAVLAGRRGNRWLDRNDFGGVGLHRVDRIDHDRRFDAQYITGQQHDGTLDAVREEDQSEWETGR